MNKYICENKEIWPQGEFFVRQDPRIREILQIFTFLPIFTSFGLYKPSPEWYFYCFSHMQTLSFFKALIYFKTYMKCRQFDHKEKKISAMALRAAVSPRAVVYIFQEGTNHKPLGCIRLGGLKYHKMLCLIKLISSLGCFLINKTHFLSLIHIQLVSKYLIFRYCIVHLSSRVVILTQIRVRAGSMCQWTLKERINIYNP